MKFIVVDNYDEMSRAAAELMLAAVKENPALTLGLATGSTPIGMYREIIAAYERGEVDFSNAKSFNLDEYYPIEKKNEQSYDFFMNDNLFSHINLPKENIHIPNGEAADPEAETVAYEKALCENGYTDIQVLGIGQNGHIGFNEPDDFLHAETHVTPLTDNTIEANARFFEKKSDVPTQALTMGMGSILKSRAILLLASGKSKVEAIAALRGDEVTPRVPATFLKLHPNVTVICDKAAFGE